MTAQQENLTPGEQRFLERQQEADREGLTLLEYYRSHGLSLSMLRTVRRQLVQKGVLPLACAGGAAHKLAAPSSRFVEVKFSASSPAKPGSGCRIRSPSGWLIEFDGLPDPSWVAGLMGVQA
jgi:hypothetical protein